MIVSPLCALTITIAGPVGDGERASAPHVRQVEWGRPDRFAAGVPSVMGQLQVADLAAVVVPPRVLD